VRRNDFAPVNGILHLSIRKHAAVLGSDRSQILRLYPRNNLQFRAVAFASF
jgi:hypothetical protein